MIEPLNNCPCCDSKMIHITHDDGAFVVICEQCEMQGPAVAIFREAIEQWNRLNPADYGSDDQTIAKSSIPTLTERDDRLAN